MPSDLSQEYLTILLSHGATPVEIARQHKISLSRINELILLYGLNIDNVENDYVERLNTIESNISTIESGLEEQVEESVSKLKYRIYVGEQGNYVTLKEAVDWFNVNATHDMEILLDAGDHPIADTITVHNHSYDLQIRGLGSSVTVLQAEVGLATKPMFDIQSNCDINKITCDGSTLALYGTIAGENCFNLNGDDTYSEITDIFMNNFNIAVTKLVGNDVFLFNFVIEDCVTGVEVDYTANVGHETMTDVEVGNIVNCSYGIKLTDAASENFMLSHLIFANITVPTPVCMLYDGVNYIIGGVCNIFNCSYDNVGTFMSGFDFHRSDGRDANIVVMGNVGEEDQTPHAKINIVDNAVTTTMVAANTNYKLLGLNSKCWIIFDQAATSGTFTITVGAETTGNINYDASAADIKSALEALTNITTVTVVQIVAKKEWTIEFLTADEGWVNHPVSVIESCATTTSVTVRQRFYVCKMGITNNRLTYLSSHKRDGFLWISGNIAVNQNSRNLTLSIKRNNAGEIYSPFTVRTGAASSGVLQGFSFSTYLEDLTQGDYFELFCASANAGDVVTVQDLNMLFNTK